ncbi:MAG: FISUMP domain-containing protein [Bacteroidales bacterium]|nr:FISUMP domain-containing protein [Bacteroidales bacterium]
MKQLFLISQILLMGILLVFTNSCKKDVDNDNNDNNNDKNLSVLSTKVVTTITQTTGLSGGNITSDGGSTVTARGVCWSTGQTPTISNNKTMDGTGTGEFSSNLSGLSPGTTYYVRAYATNSNGTAYGSAKSFTTQQGGSGSSFTDSRDGTVYQTVTIGNQIWMAENLRYLPSVIGPDSGSFTVPYYYVYDYNGTNVTTAKASSNFSTYGVLYNWPAAMNGQSSSIANPSGIQGICPTGWHLPSDSEWTQLTDFLGTDAGGKLKALTLWFTPNTGATNETGFSALPGGYRYDDDTFLNSGSHGYWWSTSMHDAFRSLYRYILCNDSNVIGGNSYYNKEFGMSVRCIKN